MEIKRRQGPRKKKNPATLMTTVKRDGSEIRFFLLLFLFTAHLFTYKVKMTKRVTLLVGISRNLLLLLLHHKTNMAVFLFEKTNSVLSSFPALKNKNVISFRMKMTGKRSDRALQSRFTHAEYLEIIRNGPTKRRHSRN